MVLPAFFDLKAGYRPAVLAAAVPQVGTLLLREQVHR